MNRFFLLCLVLCFFYFHNGLSQDLHEHQLDSLTAKEYVQKAKNYDFASLKSNFSSLSKEDKEKMLTSYLDKIISLLENENKSEALIYINIYQNLAERSDENYPNLLFVKGNIYAENVDSVNLILTIDELKHVGIDKNEIIDYIATLENKLEEIRSFVHPYKKLEGIWVADNLFWDINPSDRTCVGPGIVLKTFYDGINDTLSLCIDKGSRIAAEIAISGNKEIQSQYDLVYPYSSDSIYVCWSSEKLNKNGIDFAPVARGVTDVITSSVYTEYSQTTNKYSFGEGFLGKSLSFLGGVVLNSIFDMIFTPSKKMYTLEARLKVENEKFISGTLTYKFNKVNVDGQLLLQKECHSRVLFTKWQPECNIVFVSFHADHGLFIHPSLNMTRNDYIKEEQSKHSNYAYWRNNVFKNTLSIKKYCRQINEFDNNQYLWQIYYNDSVLNSLGVNCNYVKDQMDLGLTYSNIPDKIKKKNRDIEGIYIQEVLSFSPASVSGFRKGDIIIHANGNEIKNIEDFTSLLRIQKPGDWIYSKVLRGKKKIDLSTRLTWKM